jgi:ABC-type bacteriocin/lantibiotic exporter with double-glycine peptidase domain
MLNEERVKQMTRMALYEKKERHDLRLANDYRKSDYKGMRMVGAFLLGTLLFIILYGAVAAYVVYNYVMVIHSTEVLAAVFAGLLIYILVMFFYLRYISKSSKKKYENAYKKMKYFDNEKKKLLHMYRMEEYNINNQEEER